MTFEQELYNNFSLYLSKPYFMTFPGDVSRCDCVFVEESWSLGRPPPLTDPPPSSFADVSSGSELRQRGGDQAFPQSRDGAAGQETEEKRYLLSRCRPAENDTLLFNLVLNMSLHLSHACFQTGAFCTNGASVTRLN